MAAAAVPKNLCQFLQMCALDFLWGGILSQHCNRSLPEKRIKHRLVFRKGPVQEGNQFPFQVSRHIDQIGAVAAQLPKCQDFVLWYIAGLTTPKAYKVGNDERIPCIGFGFADIEFA